MTAQPAWDTDRFPASRLGCVEVTRKVPAGTALLLSLFLSEPPANETADNSLLLSGLVSESLREGPGTRLPYSAVPLCGPCPLSQGCEFGTQRLPSAGASTVGTWQHLPPPTDVASLLSSQQVSKKRKPRLPPVL